MRFSIPGFRCSSPPFFALVLACVLANGTRFARAELVPWYPALVTDPGRGFSPHSPSTFDRPRPFVAELDAATSTGAAGGSLDAYFVQSKEDIAKYLGINLDASVHALAYNGDLSLGLTDSFNYSEDTLSFLVRGRRDFGQLTGRARGMTAEFANEVRFLRQTLRGTDLYLAITNRFGTHFISGYRSSARFAVLYSFKFASRAQARTFRSRFSGGSGSVDLSGAVDSVFSENKSKVSIEFHLETLLRGTPPSLWPTNVIRSPEEFHSFTQGVESYWRSLVEADGVPTDYIAEPIENLPGMLELLDGFRPSPFPSASYERFLLVHGRLGAWHRSLLDWSTDARGMNWMNLVGQTLVRSLERDAFRELASMEARAREHFELGTPLVVEDSTLNFLSNLDRIPRPKFGVIRSSSGFFASPSGGGNFRAVACFINCGAKALTVDHPFRVAALQVSDADHGTEVDAVPISDFENFVRQGWSSGNASLVDAIFQSSAWRSVLDDSSECRILGFFVLVPANGDEGLWSVVVKDGADRVVDAFNVLDTPSAPCSASGTTSMETDLALQVVGPSAVSAVDTRVSYLLSITNNGRLASYGTVVKLPVPEGMQALSVQGTQGQAVTTDSRIEVVGGSARFLLGPLAYGRGATVRWELSPLRAGTLHADAPAVLVAGEGLTDLVASNNVALLPSVTAVPPALEILRAGSAVELRWVSETGRLVVEAAETGLESSWKLINVPGGNGPMRHVLMPAVAQRQFFRLRDSP
jgi:hypothetical protein